MCISLPAGKPRSSPGILLSRHPGFPSGRLAPRLDRYVVPVAIYDKVQAHHFIGVHLLDSGLALTVRWTGKKRFNPYVLDTVDHGIVRVWLSVDSTLESPHTHGRIEPVELGECSEDVEQVARLMALTQLAMAPVLIRGRNRVESTGGVLVGHKRTQLSILSPGLVVGELRTVRGSRLRRVPEPWSGLLSTHGLVEAEVTLPTLRIGSEGTTSGERIVRVLADPIMVEEGGGVFLLLAEPPCEGRRSGLPAPVAYGISPPLSAWEVAMLKLLGAAALVEGPAAGSIRVRRARKLYEKVRYSLRRILEAPGPGVAGVVEDLARKGVFYVGKRGYVGFRSPQQLINIATASPDCRLARKRIEHERAQASRLPSSLEAARRAVEAVPEMEILI